MRGPINDFNTKVSTFFTWLVFEVQNYFIFIKYNIAEIIILRKGSTAQWHNGAMAQRQGTATQRRNGATAQRQGAKA